MEVKQNLLHKILRPIHSQVRRYSAPLDSEVPPSKQKYVPKSGTYPKGFAVSSVHVGVKASNTKSPDLAILNSEVPCHAAAVFTKNRFQAAPVQISRKVLSTFHKKDVQSLVINSGCANAVTGQQGVKDADAMSAKVDECFQRDHEKTEKRQTLVMSTGVIGQRLPAEKILSAIPKACSAMSSSHDAWLTAAQAICTTDTFPKLISRQFTLPSTGPSVTYSLAGMAKGAGMIRPNMATLLSVLCTDAPIKPRANQYLLRSAVKKSFNRIAVDGDMSTNDTVALFANGAAAPPSAKPIDTPSESSDYQAFEEILSNFARELAQLVVRDGEGATKFAHVRVLRAPDGRTAKNVANSVATSPLVKTALYGKDANWGRILCAVGGAYPTISFAPEAVSVAFVPVANSPEAAGGKLALLEKGEPVDVDEERAARILSDEDLEIEIDLGAEEQGGKQLYQSEYWFCDLSHEYVTINGDYRT